MPTSPYNIQDTGGTLSKNDIILGAYSQLRISGITRAPTPEDLETALDRLEDMAAQFNATMPIGYFFEDEPSPNSDSGVTRSLAQAFKTNLATRLIPDFNKQVPAVLLAQSSASLSFMASQSAAQRIREVPYPQRMPVGSGNSSWSRWSHFYRSTQQEPLNSSNSQMYIGDINNFTEHFDAYLNNTNSEEIASYSIVADSGLIISGDSNTSTDVVYTVQAGTPSNSNATNVLQITIIATTNLGRVQTRIRYIQVNPRS